jgi:hypothetical protein
MPLGFIFAMQGNYFFNWIPAFVGMTSYADDVRRFPPRIILRHAREISGARKMQVEMLPDQAIPPRSGGFESALRANMLVRTRTTHA